MNAVQKSLNAGIYMHGPLHTKRESGVLYFKGLVREQLKKHFATEAAEGREIWPAKRYQQLHSTVYEEEDFCAAICGLRTHAAMDIEDL